MELCSFDIEKSSTTVMNFIYNGIFFLKQMLNQKEFSGNNKEFVLILLCVINFLKCIENEFIEF